MDTTLLDIILNSLKSPRFVVPVVTVLISGIIVKVSSNLIDKMINKNSNSIEIKRRNTIAALLENLIKYAIWIIAVIIIISSWGFDVSTFVAGLGIAGAVIGLAVQDAIKDIIMGCNIIMDNYYVIGDTISYKDFTGEVIELGLKNTKIKNVDGTVLVIANRNITEVKNLSQKKATVSVTIPTSYEEKEERVEKALREAIEEIDKLSLVTSKTEYLGIDVLNSSSVDYLIRARCKAGDQWELKRKILSIVKKSCDKNKIKIPYNQIEVHNG